MCCLFNMPQITLNTSINKIKKFVTGKGVTVYGNESGDQKLDLDFENLKDYNRMVRNFKGNKGFILKGSQMREAKHNGGDILKDLKRGWNKFTKDATVRKIGKRAIKILAPMAGEAIGTAVGTYAGNPAMGMMAGKMIGDTVADKYGEGFRQDVGRTFSRAMKVAKPVAIKGFRYIKSELNRPEVRKIAKDLIKSSIQKSGVVDQVGDMVNRQTGTTLGNELGPAINRGIDNALKVEGGAIKRGRGRPRKPVHTEADVVMEATHQGMGGDRAFHNDIKRRMEIVRSYRKKTVEGGSFLANI